MFDRLMSREARVLPRFVRLVSQVLAITQRTMEDGWRAFSEVFLMPRYHAHRGWKRFVPRSPPVNPYSGAWTTRMIQEGRMAETTFGHRYYDDGNHDLREVHLGRLFAPDTGNYG